MKPVFFPSPPDWHAWLEKHHQTHQELLVGFHKKDSGKPSITWPEAVDGALCFGWIDGVRRSLNETSYVIRFTPRRPRSIWSAINIRRVAELTKLGLMRPAGVQAFEKRTGDRSEIYAYEQRRGAKLPAAYKEKFRANKKAWKILSGTAALVPEDGKLAGDQREERRNATEAVGPAHQRLGAPTSHTRAQTDDRKE